MAPPLNVKPENTNKQQSYLKQKEPSLTKFRTSPHDRSHSRDLSQPGRPRSLQNPAPKSSSLLNVSKINSNHPSDKYNKSESEMMGRHLHTEISKKTKT